MRNRRDDGTMRCGRIGRAIGFRPGTGSVGFWTGIWPRRRRRRIGLGRGLLRTAYAAGSRSETARQRSLPATGVLTELSNNYFEKCIRNHYSEHHLKRSRWLSSYELHDIYVKRTRAMSPSRVCILPKYISLNPLSNIESPRKLFES